ncbi:MAG TPA: EthD family reductase, partial [Terriglobales bacterium]|nr:EthD family reductase [Terriglobales bacterium]
MAAVKLLVLYPRPKDIEAFETLYQKEHVPMAVEKLVGKTKFVATKILGSPQGTPPFYRIAEIHFPSRQALEACAATPGAQETVAHAIRISTGGAPIIMIAEEETFTF